MGATSRSLADPVDSGDSCSIFHLEPEVPEAPWEEQRHKPVDSRELHLSSSVRSGVGFTPVLEGEEMEKRGSPATGPADSTLKLATKKGPHILCLGHQGQVSKGCHGDEAAILVGEDIPRWSRYHTGRARAVENPDVRGNERGGISK